MGKTSERLVDPSLSKYDVFNPECLIMGGITYIGLGFVYAMIKRMEIRERFGIKGSGAGDFCAAYWCACCVVLQNVSFLCSCAICDWDLSFPFILLTTSSSPKNRTTKSGLVLASPARAPSSSRTSRTLAWRCLRRPPPRTDNTSKSTLCSSLRAVLAPSLSFLSLLLITLLAIM